MQWRQRRTSNDVMGVKTVRACQHGRKIGKMRLMTILLHGWPDTKALTIGISPPRPHHMEKIVSREQHCMMGLNQPEMNVSFLSLHKRKLLVLDARFRSPKNSKIGPVGDAHGAHEKQSVLVPTGNVTCGTKPAFEKVLMCES